MRHGNPYRRQWLTPRPGLVTQRERAIGSLLASGLSTPEIAATLGVSRSIVGNDRRLLYAKLCLGGQVDLTHYAIRHAWVTLGPHRKSSEPPRQAGKPPARPGTLSGGPHATQRTTRSDTR